MTQNEGVENTFFLGNSEMKWYLYLRHIPTIKVVLFHLSVIMATLSYTKMPIFDNFS